MIAALIAAAAAATSAPALVVDPAADAGAPCAGNAALDGALRQRLPGVPVESRTPAAGDLRAALRREPESWALELSRHDGEVVLRRRLAFEAGQCGVAADTAALVIDRFLEEIQWSGRPASVAPLPLPPKPPKPPEPPSPAVAAAPAAPAAAPPSPPPEAVPPPAAADRVSAPALRALGRERPPRVSLALGPAGWLGLPDDFRGAMLAEVMLRPSPAFEAGLIAIGALPSSTTVFVGGAARGTVRVQTGLLALAGAACVEPGALRLCGGPLAGVRAATGQGGGQLFRQASALMVHPELGLRGLAALQLGGGVSAGLELVAAAALGDGTFNVAGVPEAQRRLAIVDLALALRVGWAPF